MRPSSSSSRSPQQEAEVAVKGGGGAKGGWGEEGLSYRPPLDIMQTVGQQASSIHCDCPVLGSACSSLVPPPTSRSLRGATVHVDRRHRPAALEPDRPGARPSGGRLEVEPTKNRWVEEMYRHPLDTATARDGRRKRPARSSGLIGAAPTRLAAGPNAGPSRSLLATPTRIRALRHRSGLTDPRDPVAPPHGRRPAAMLLAKYGDARSS